jgi:hypothetical protein
MVYCEPPEPSRMSVLASVATAGVRAFCSL